MYRFAAEGNCVLLGYGAGPLLREVRHVIRVRAVAPRDLRVERVLAAARSTNAMTREQADDLIRRTDRDRARYIRYLFNLDIDDPAYDPAAHAGISYREAMGRIHAVAADGSVLRDVEVFRRAYQLVGLGWLYAPTRWPLLGALVDRLYGLWAGARLRLTRRPDLDELCDLRRERCATGACSRP